MVLPEEGQKAGAPSVAPAPAGQTAGDALGSEPLAADTDRSIIRTGSVDIEVRSVTDAFEQVRTIATGAGGFVADSSFVGGKENQIGRLTLRVPADKFGDVVTQLRGLAVEVRSTSSNARDVTGETSDLEATLRNLRAVEAQYTTLLTRAGSISDILQVQERLNQVRLQIDRTEARRALIQSQTEMSRLSVTLQPVGAPGSSNRGLRDAASEAWQASLDTLAGIATTAVTVAVYSWWIIPLAGLAAFLLRRRWLRRSVAEASAPVG